LGAGQRHEGAAHEDELDRGEGGALRQPVVAQQPRLAQADTVCRCCRLNHPQMALTPSPPCPRCAPAAAAGPRGRAPGGGGFKRKGAKGGSIIGRGRRVWWMRSAGRRAGLGAPLPRTPPPPPPRAPPGAPARRGCTARGWRASRWARNRCNSARETARVTAAAGEGAGDKGRGALGRGGRGAGAAACSSGSSGGARVALMARVTGAVTRVTPTWVEYSKSESGPPGQ
jgi:hypothetical protein